MRPIDGDALLKEANADGAYGYVSAYQIANAPTIEVEPIIPAFWKPVYESEISGYDPVLSGRDPVGAYVCTNCGAEAIFDCNDQFVLSERCHKCGAHMDAPRTAEGVIIND